MQGGQEEPHSLGQLCVLLVPLPAWEGEDEAPLELLLPGCGGRTAPRRQEGGWGKLMEAGLPCMPPGARGTGLEVVSKAALQCFCSMQWLL